jgi:hypothetical protein
MQAHLLKIEIAELALISEIGPHTERRAARAGIEIGDFGGEFRTASGIDGFFETRNAVCQRLGELAFALTDGLVGLFLWVQMARSWPCQFQI